MHVKGGGSNSTFEFGTSTDGTKNLLDEIKAEMITNVAEKVTDIGAIKNACDLYWEGVSKDRFIANLTKDTELVKTNLEKAYNKLVEEVNAASLQVHDFDKNLIEEN